MPVRKQSPVSKGKISVGNLIPVGPGLQFARVLTKARGKYSILIRLPVKALVRPTFAPPLRWGSPLLAFYSLNIIIYAGAPLVAFSVHAQLVQAFFPIEPFTGRQLPPRGPSNRKPTFFPAAKRRLFKARPRGFCPVLSVIVQVFRMTI